MKIYIGRPGGVNSPPKAIGETCLPEIKTKTEKWGNLIPISKVDYEALKESIRRDGKLHYPIKINQNGDVLDGHNRLKVCKELGTVEPRFETIHFDNDLEEERFVRIINANRRHMNKYQKAKQALALEPIEAELARKRQLAGKKATDTLSPDEPKVKGNDKGKGEGEVIKNVVGGRVKEIVSQDVGLSPTTYFRLKTIIQKGSEEQNKRLEQDDSKINTEYNKIIRAQKRVKAREEAEAFAAKLRLPDKVQLLNKDSTNLEGLEEEEIPDNSVDLIITDPPYLKGYLPVFDGLAKLAIRKLKEGGSLLFYFGQPHLEELMIQLSKYKSEGLYYQWPLAVIHTGSQARFHCLGLQVGWKPMLWYKKRKVEAEQYDSHKPAWQPDFCDVIQSAQPDKLAHDWAQSPAEAEYVIEHLTINENSLVLDPFLGSGAFGIAAVRLGRYFIGIEIDKETYENAKSYIIKETQQQQQKPSSGGGD